mgnify:CR=1 FL=1
MSLGDNAENFARMYDHAPIADESYGFYGSLHSARGRQFSIDLRKEF